jgi:16S rRNA (adenine1518-N6/adenine1519-N6)-dimethyltransferase
MARQYWGQHFLVDPGWRKRIFESLPHRRTDTWIEIGAGHGEMTQLLAATEGQVIAVEKDTRLAAGLRNRLCLEPTQFPRVEIVVGDILKLDPTKLASDPFRVYGNLPYYITSPILHHLFACAQQIISIHIVVQWEVAQRIVASPGRRAYGYLSAACQFYTRPEIVVGIPPGAFRPPPQVRSALVSMLLPGAGASVDVTDERRFLKFVQLCFSQKRKTLRNNLRARFSEDLIRAGLAACELGADARAEQLSVAQFASLFRGLTAAHAAPDSLRGKVRQAVFD